MARHTFSALLKLTLHGQESLCHKGGVLHAVWKHKGPRDQCSSFRSILVSSHIGKCIHRSLRQHQFSVFAQFAQREQLGGRPRIPVTLGVHMGRAFMRSRRAQGHSVAMLYLDLTEAFYRILRPLALGGPISDEQIAHVGARLGLSPELLTDLHRHLLEPPAIVQAGLPEHLQNALRAIHMDTHFKVEGQRDTCRTTLGSRPGDCFADFVFSFLWGRLLRALQEHIVDMGLSEYVPQMDGLCFSAVAPGDPQAFLGPTWMDDTCICASDPCPQNLERKISQITGKLLSLCDSHGLLANLSAGKTEILLSLQGSGSRALKIKYFGPTSEGVMLILGEDAMKKVRVVSKYVHLGCLMHHRPDNRQEARRRLGIAHQAFTQHRRHLLGNPQLSLKRRVELFHTLVMSRLCYGTESWTFVDAGTKCFVHNAMLRLFRRLLCRGHAEHLSDDEILTEVGVNTPTEFLRLARLRYLGTLYRCHDLVPWGLLHQDQEWMSMLAEDLQWMWFQLRNASPLLDPAAHFPQWEDFLRHHPSYWRRLVRRAGDDEFIVLKFAIDVWPRSLSPFTLSNFPWPLPHRW
eukprot:s1029_g6.t1